MPYTEEMVRRLVVQRRIFLALNTVAAIAMAILLVQHRHLSHQQRIDRRTTIIRSCNDQNARHVETIRTLDNLIAKLPPSQRAQANRSKQFTVLLINALAPVQDCEKLADRLLRERK